MAEPSPENLSGGNAPVFQLFPRLPMEIRLKIWRISCFNTTRNIFLPGYKSCRSWIRCQSAYPTLLSTCKEARHEGLKHYEAFDCHGGDVLARHPAQIQGKVYINWAVDRLVIYSREVYDFPIRDRDNLEASMAHTPESVGGDGYIDNSMGNMFPKNKVQFLAMHLASPGDKFITEYPWSVHLRGLILIEVHSKRRQSSLQWDVIENIPPQSPSKEGEKFSLVGMYDEFYNEFKHIAAKNIPSSIKLQILLPS
ncbi:hypothetical protein SBOR_8433 [Sclerotinia borealis F-4128]|uniref:2EXR domain-containing protein n=1 Tax=Sclerotinia borealis (strain F-4128) TaxID=1432307 RepID=W9C315_SCLBF|nr:hypothetical protein SBOR_8433 [Sclerotinia borealis F-4128]